MTPLGFLGGRSSGASSNKQPIYLMSLFFAFHPRGGAGGRQRAEALIPHGHHRIPHVASPTEERWEPTRTRGSFPAAADFWFLLSLDSCDVIGALPRYSNGFGDLLWAGAQPQTRQPFANWSTTIIQHPSDNVGICLAMRFIPSRGCAHGHTVDHRWPPKYPKTSGGSFLNAPRRPPFCRCLPRGRLSQSSPTVLERARLRNEVIEPPRSAALKCGFRSFDGS
jgi:hypothetical protein